MAFLDAKVKSIILNALSDEEIKKQADSWTKERIQAILKEISDGLAKDQKPV